MNLPQNHHHMGKIMQATRVATPGPDPRRARIIIIFLAVCTALQMTSYGMIFPLFARKIGDFGDGVAVLPQRQAVEYANRAMDVLEKENRIREEIKRGSTLGQTQYLAKWDVKK